MKRLRRRMKLMALAAMLLAGTAGAAGVWDGGGTNANWDTTDNWDDNSVPATGADVTFGTGFTSGTDILLNGNRTANSLTINTTTAIDFENNTLTLTSGNLTTSGGAVDRDMNSSVDIGAASAVWAIDGGVNANGNNGLDVTGNITSSGSLTKTGAGTLNLARSGGMPNLTGDVIVGGGMLTTRYQGSQLSYANSLTLSNASFYADSHGNNLPATGDIRLYNGTLDNKNSGATRPNNVVLLGGNNTWNFNSSGSTLSGVISGGGAGTTFTIDAEAGTIRFSNDNNSFTSKLLLKLWFYNFEFTSIANAGVNSALGAATGADATISTEGYVTFRYVGTNAAGHATDRPFTTTQARPTTIEASGVGPLTWNGTVYINGNEGQNGGTLGGTGVGILNGKLTIDNYDLKKTGSGTWILTAPNNDIGRYTYIQSGTLLANNASGSATGNGDVIIQNGGTLGGTGIVAGANHTVTVNAGGRLAPGGANAIGALTFNPGASGKVVLSNAVAAAGSGALRFDLAGPGAGDKIVVSSGTLEIGTGLLGIGDFAFTDAGGLDGGSYTLIQNAGTLSGTLDGGNLTAVIASQPSRTGTLSISGNNVVLKIAGHTGTVISIR